MIVKIHKDNYSRIVLAVCDKELLGKKFEEGNKQLDLASDFYEGEEKTEKETGDLMRNAYMINLVGDKSVGLAIKEEIVDKNSVMKIKDVPYAQVISSEI